MEEDDVAEEEVEDHDVEDDDFEEDAKTCENELGDGKGG